TFWYTNEYIPTNGSFNWKTRIGSFRFQTCGSSPTPTPTPTPTPDPTPTPTPPPGPNAPSNLTAVAVSSTQINLSWTDNSPDEDGFNIERCTGNGCTNFGQIAQVGKNVAQFPNTGLTKNTWYRYRVRAFNAGGDSAYSNIITEKTPPR